MYKEKLMYYKPIGFAITNGNRQTILESLYNSTIIGDKSKLDETQKNLINNYQTISEHYDDFFDGKDNTAIFDYITHLLDNVHAVESIIQENKDVPTIFEVINSRGLVLKPHEILKAKLLGILDHREKEEANNIWMELLNNYFHANLSIDRFFRDYLRARYHIFDAQDNDYHKLFDTNICLRQEFGNLTDTQVIFDKIVHEIRFYAHLYLSLKSNRNYEYVGYNKHLEQDMQYQRYLSSINISDKKDVQDKKLI